MKTARLLIRFSALGDVVLCSALVKKLQTLYPGDGVIFLTQASFKKLLVQSFPQPLRVLGVDLSSAAPLRLFLYGYHLAALLRSEAYTHIEFFDLHGLLKSRAFIGGFRLRALGLGLHIKTKSTPKKTLLRNLSVLLGRDLLGARFNFQSHLALAEPSTENFFPTLFSVGQRPREPHLLIAPDAQHWKKRWTVGHWEELLPQLLQKIPQLRLTLVGARSCLPDELQEDLVKTYPERVKNLLGQTSLEDLPGVAATSHLTLCGNSAWLHISEAVGTPVISLAGPIVPGFGFSPWRKESTEMAVTELNCRPCTRHGGGVCKYVGADFHACMKRITPPELFQKISDKLRELVP